MATEHGTAKIAQYMGFLLFAKGPVSHTEGTGTNSGFVPALAKALRHAWTVRTHEIMETLAMVARHTRPGVPGRNDRNMAPSIPVT